MSKYYQPIKQHIFVDGIESKECVICKTIKPLTEFAHNGHSWDKRRKQCLKCSPINVEGLKATWGIKRPGMTVAIPHQIIDGVEHKCCPHCQRYLPLSKFYSRPTRYDGVSQWCRTCEVKHYEEQRRAKGQTRKATYKTQRPQVNQYKHIHKHCAIIYKGGKCVHCGKEYDGTNSCIFDFHHTDPSQKEFCPSTGSTWSKTQPELDKCVLLCTNCHRMEHDSLPQGYIDNLIDNIEDGGDIFPNDLLNKVSL